MKLEFENISQFDSQQLYELLLPVINEVREDFSYVLISDQDYSLLVLEEIAKSNESYSGKVPYYDFFKKNMNTKLSQMVKGELTNPKTSFAIINNYINQRFSGISRYEESLKCFRELSSFFEKYSFIPSLDLLSELFSRNKNFSRIGRIVVGKERLLVTKGKAEEILDDDFFVSAIDTYCMLNNIDIERNREMEDDDSIYDTELISNNLRLYLNDVFQHPLLTDQEEKELARRIVKGDDEAKKRFIESNLRLVVSVAKKYVNRGLPFLDLIQEGNVGLIRAVNGYDVEKGFRFSTYATFYIKSTIQRAIADKGRTIRIPVHLQEKFAAYNMTKAYLTRKLDREPTADEIAEEMKIPVSVAAELYKLQADTISLNSFIDEDKSSEFGDFIPADGDTLDDILIEDNMQLQVRELLERCKLTPRESEVLMFRYGFYNGRIVTLEEIGGKYHLTRERVRQIEELALKKIRKSPYINEFVIYMEHPERAMQTLSNFREKYSKPSRNYHKKNREDSDSEEKDEKNFMSRKVQTIYQLFGNYSREQVDSMLTMLTKEERELVTLRYGEDLDNPVFEKLDKNNRVKFYGSLVPRMRRLLLNPVYFPVSKDISVSNSIPEEKIEEVTCSDSEKSQDEISPSEQIANDSLEQASIDLSGKDKGKVIPFVNGEKTEPSQVDIESINQSNDLSMTKEEYIKMLELLRTPSFTQMMNILSVKESIIIALKLGYVDGKYFSTESIASFLEIEENEVRETTKKALSLYKESINDFLDNAISVVTDKNVSRKILSNGSNSNK